MKDVFIFGDSITYGQWDEQGGWVQRLRSSFDQSYIAHRSEMTCFYNLGVPADTTEGVLKRFRNEVAARHKDGKQKVIIFAIGLNDAHFVHKTKRPKFTSEAFTDNLKSLLSQAREVSDKIAFVGLNPVDEGRVTPLPWNPEKSYQNERIAEFNFIIEKLAKDENIFFADVWGSFTKQDHKSFLSDGLHPNASGHRRIAEKVHAFLTSLDGKSARATG